MIPRVILLFNSYSSFFPKLNLYFIKDILGSTKNAGRLPPMFV